MKKEANREQFEYIIHGPIFSSLVKLSLPIMVSQFMQTLYNLADTFWVGKVGAEAVAAISLSFPLIFLMISVAAGLTIAGTALIAQYQGAGDIKQVEKMAGQLISFIGAFSILVSVVGFLWARDLLSLMGAAPEIIDPATGYLKIIFAGMPFMFGFFIFSASLRGIGDTMTPAVMMFSSVILNIILDPVLIFGLGPFPAMGVEGAAVATIFSRAVVAIYAIYIFANGSRGIQLKYQNMIPDWPTIKMIIRIGLPSSIEQSMVSLGQLFMTTLVASFGTITLAAFGIVNRLISIPVILAMGFSAATTTMVGQNIGADQKKRAERTALVSITTVFTSLTLIGAFFMIFPEWSIGVFNREPGVLRDGQAYLLAVAWNFGFIGVLNAVNGVFKGAGKTIPPMIISTTNLWIFRVLLAFLLSRTLGWGTAGLWWAVAISNIAGALLGVIWLKVADWSEKVIGTRENNPA